MLSVPHPILASEDDEEYVIRTVLGLPGTVEEFFDTLEANFIDGKDCKVKANLLFFKIQRQLSILNDVQSSAFRPFDESKGVTRRDDETPKMLSRLSRLFLEDVVGVSPSALSWKRPCVQLAQECAEHMQGGRIQFPWHMRLRRRLVTVNSSLFIFFVIVFSLIVLFNVVLVVVLPAVRPKISVGIPLGAVAAALLVIVSVLLLVQFVYASKALYTLHNNLLQESIAWRSAGTTDLFQFQSGTENRGLNGYGDKIKIKKGRNTQKGYYTIPYMSGLGYIDGKQLDSQVVMIAYDENFLITRWNNAAEVITGFLEDGCVGKPIGELVISHNDGDICEELKKARKNNLIKIKLRALAMAPATLYTVVAPIVDSDGKRLGSILICANAKDNLRDYRTYIHNYQVNEIKESIRQIIDRGNITNTNDAVFLSSLERFSLNCTSNRVEELAREMVADWEWTNKERFLGRVFGGSVSSHDVVTDPLFPQTICINPLVPNTIGMMVSLLAGHCAVRLSVNNFQGSFFSLVVNIKHSDANSRLAENVKIDESLMSLIRNTAGNFYPDGNQVALHFPCQVAAILEDHSESEPNTSEQAQQLAQARAIINCTVNVVTAITNMVDQHNVSLLLLKTMFVSLTSVQEKSDLEQRLRSDTVDVIVCDRNWYRECEDLLSSKEYGAIIIPLVNGSEPLPKSHEFVLRLPLVGRDVQETMVAVGTVVSKKRNAIAAREERERVLTLRQDSPWTKGKLLGRGSYGAVYEATSDLTGGKMAVKMFYFVNDSEDSIDKLLNEIEIMCSLNHPNIVHYFHCERKDNNVNLFMELCLCSLTDLINGKRKRPPHFSCVGVIRQVLTAIVYLHSRGTAHRDVKPQNILLKDESGLIKLTDFGTARRGEAMKEVKGTFRYMAPEVYKGLPHSLPCDIWSIGCLVCELFACPPKFMENATLLGELTSVAPYLENLPNNALLRDFVYKCFKLDANQRPTSSTLLTHPFLSTNAISSEVDLLPTVFDLTQSEKTNATKQSLFSISSNA